MAFVVKYRVLGKEYQSESYATREIVDTHRDDIAGFEGVTEARVQELEPKRAIDRLLEREDE